MATASEAGRRASSAAGGHNPWLIAGVVSIATFMEVLDVTIVAVALQHIAGSLGVSYDEATWVSTTYLVANAIVLPISGWLSTVIGRKRFYMIAVATFTVSSVLCGLAWNLQALLFFRILQGLGGGGLAPSEQSILADTFPPAKRGQAFALYGLAVVVAPALGPTLGGIITDNASWHWIFFLNIPMGILSLILVGTLVSEPSTTEKQRQELLKDGLKVDWLGMLFVVVGLGSLEVVLDEGQKYDWFNSSFITTFTIISTGCLLASIPWELTRKEPIVNVRLIFQRQFGLCFALMLILGGMLVATTQLIPQIVQTLFGYTATLAGYTLSPGGLVLLAVMPIAGFLTGKVQPKYLVMTGFAIIALAMNNLTNIYGDVDYSWFVWARIHMTIGFPFLFLPITTASYIGLRPEQTNQASALINVARNLGGSIMVSFTQTMLANRTQYNQSRLAEHVTPSSDTYKATLAAAKNYFIQQGSSLAEATNQAIAWIGQALERQATFLAYKEIFFWFMIIALCTIPLALLLRPQDLKAPSAG